jgi:hypothetical protein
VAHRPRIVRVTQFYFSAPRNRTHAIIASRRPELYTVLTDPNSSHIPPHHSKKSLDPHAP